MAQEKRSKTKTTGRTKQVKPKYEPREQTETKFDEVIRLIIEEGKSLTKACKEVELSRTQFHKMVTENDTKANDYARACELRALFLAEETIDISDDCDKTVAGVMKAKEQIGARQWYASKMYSKQFGNKVEADVKVTERVKIVLDIGTDEEDESDN